MRGSHTAAGLNMDASCDVCTAFGTGFHRDALGAGVVGHFGSPLGPGPDTTS
jgi:hypothetical protein